jgi:hypothetical protein
MTQDVKEYRGNTIFTNWVYRDITESGYNAFLQRFHSSVSLVACSPTPNIQIRGYGVVVCWEERYPKDCSPQQYYSSMCALLESSS